MKEHRKDRIGLPQPIPVSATVAGKRTRTQSIEPVTEVINMEPLDVTADTEPGTIRFKQAMALHHAKTGSKQAALRYMVAVDAALRDFVAYTDPLVDELASQGTTASMIVEAIGKAALGHLAKPLIELAKDALARDMCKTAQRVVSNSLLRSVSASDAQTPQALRTSIRIIIERARRAAWDLIRWVEEQFVKRIDVAIVRLENEVALEPSDDLLIGQFYTVGAIDESLERYGLPARTTSHAIRLDTFEGLVEAFATVYIWQTASASDRNAMVWSDEAPNLANHENSLPARAARMAAEARETHELTIGFP